MPLHPRMPLHPPRSKRTHSISDASTPQRRRGSPLSPLSIPDARRLPAFRRPRGGLELVADLAQEVVTVRLRCVILDAQRRLTVDDP